MTRWRCGNYACERRCCGHRRRAECVHRDGCDDGCDGAAAAAAGVGAVRRDCGDGWSVWPVRTDAVAAAAVAVDAGIADVVAAAG